MRCTKPDRQVWPLHSSARSWRRRPPGWRACAPTPELLARALELGLYETGFGSNEGGVALASCAGAAIGIPITARFARRAPHNSSYVP